jgi:hypothetical protein
LLTAFFTEIFPFKVADLDLEDDKPHPFFVRGEDV